MIDTITLTAGQAVRLRRRGAPKATIVQVYKRNCPSGAAGDVKVELVSTGEITVVSPSELLV